MLSLINEARAPRFDANVVSYIFSQRLGTATADPSSALKPYLMEIMSRMTLQGWIQSAWNVVSAGEGDELCSGRNVADRYIR